MKKILITGASGYLAHRLVPIAANYGAVTGVARDRRSVYAPADGISLDITDASAVQRVMDHVQPDALIHAAAVNPGSGDSLMDAVNHQAAGVIAQQCRQRGTRLVLVSTDMVHTGLCAPYLDDAAADPINLYGASKASGEALALSICPEAAVVRTSLIYGLDKIDRGTAGFQQRLLAGDPLSLFSDVLRQPVWVDSLATALCRLAVECTEESGLLNVAGDEVLSRAQFATILLQFWGTKVTGNVRFISGDGITGLPQDLRLVCTRANQLGIDLPGVNAVLAR